ncbi:MAG TPA: hypothetical protein VJ853_04915 [Thermoanaerobaculia bacterium]|nr:hypothetical protein [Thermoanaerobaculia bacterium]
MKRLALVLAAFAFLPAFTLIENQPVSQVTINGKAFGRGVVLQGGIIAVSLEDFARAAGAPITLEPVFQLQGNRLIARGMSAGGEYKEQQKITVASAAAAKIERYKAAPGQIIAVRKAGVISNNVMMVNGKAYIPLSDIVRAFGDGSVRGFTGGVRPGTAINLTTAPNASNGLLIGLL